MRQYPGGGAFALFFHPHPREFATQNKKSANARGLARGGGGGWAQLELTDALRWLNLGNSCQLLNYLHCTVLSTVFLFKRKKGLEAGALPRVPWV